MAKLPHIFVDASPLVRDHFSGVGHYTLGIVRGFDQLAAEGKLTYSLIAEAGKAGNLHQYGLKNFRRVIKNPLPDRIIRQLARRNIPLSLDLIFGKGSYYFPDFTAWKLSGGSTATVVIHDMAFRAIPESLDQKNLAYLESVVPKSIQNAQNIIAVSEFTKSEIIKYYNVDPAKITVVPAAIDPEHFYRRDQAETRAVKNKYGLPDKYILSLGNLEPRKNYSRLIDAYASLPKDITDEYALVLVGAGGWKNSDLHAKIADLKEKGYQIVIPEQFVTDQDLPALYSGAEFFVLVSLYEGFGMQVLEAMACGTPVLASNTSSLPEVAGDNAIYTNPANVNDIAENLKQMLNGVRPQHAKQQVNKFSWTTSATKTAATTAMSIS